MPKRFMLTQDVFLFKDAPSQVAGILQKSPASSRSIAQLNLKEDANKCLVVPADHAVVMMGTTSELTEELETLRSRGIKSFVTGQQGSHNLPRYAGRTKAMGDGGVFNDVVSVIVLLGSPVAYDESSWKKLLGGGSLSVNTLIDTELAQIKELKAR